VKILIYLHHPAHFHLFKNVIKSLKENHELIILATKKDILEELLQNKGIDYINVLPEGRRNNKVSIAFGLLKQDFRLHKICIKYSPDILVGTSTEITHIGRLLKIPSLFLNEDDIDVIPLIGKFAYPFAQHILTPNICRVGKYESKKIGYESYHELAYLHPNHFTPDRLIVEKYFILRLAQLKAHHDDNINGINSHIVIKLLDLLKTYGNVYITSERELEPELEPYRIDINPIDMHHMLSFAEIFIGDSQTMAAEAAVLGVPFIRFNDFVGRISYLDELENKYQLGYGIKTDKVDLLYKKVEELLQMPNKGKVFQKRKKNALRKNRLCIIFNMAY